MCSKENGNYLQHEPGDIVGFGTLLYNERSPYNTAFTTPYTDANGLTTNVVCCSGQGFNFNGSDGRQLLQSAEFSVDQRTSQWFDFHGVLHLFQGVRQRRQLSAGSASGYWAAGFQPRQRVDSDFAIYELPIGRGQNSWATSAVRQICFWVAGNGTRPSPPVAACRSHSELQRTATRIEIPDPAGRTRLADSTWVPVA